MDPLIALPVILSIVWGLWIKVRKMRRDDSPTQEYVGMVVISFIGLVFLIVCWWMTRG